MTGRITSVNVGRPRRVANPRGASVTTAIWKAQVDGPVAVRGVNLDGDGQADRQVHGGVDKAVYAYAEEDLRWWADELDASVAPGTFGENLTVTDVDVTGAVVGERWRAGTALLEVCQPRSPCYKLGLRMEDAAFPRRFSAAGRPGAYLRIVQEGEVSAGDPVEVVERPSHGVTIGDVATAYHHDRSLAPRLLKAPQLARPFADWARSVTTRRPTVPPAVTDDLDSAEGEVRGID